MVKAMGVSTTKPVTRITRHPFFMLAVVILAFLLAFFSVLPIKVQQMQPGELFVFQITPLSYWIGVAIIVAVLFSMIPRLNEKRNQILFIFSSIMLMISFRMIFSITFTSVPAYEPDTTNYIHIVSSWVRSGVDFGVDGNYQHNFPMSFLTAFAFIKLGVPLDTFYRVAPFIIFALIIIFLYLLVEAVMPETKKRSALPLLSVFLFSFSSLGYWVTVHYSPDLFGSLMYFVCLYLGVRFAKSGKWNIKSLAPVLVSLFVLILSHHLSTLYLIITFFGLSLSVWFFKPTRFKKGAVAFFVLAIFTYTLWFVYGSLIYPSFFNVYVYLSGFTSVTQQSAGAGLLNNLTFAIYPAFILVLFAIEFLNIIKIKNPFSLFKNTRQKLREIQIRESSNNLLIFSAGFILVFILFIVGIGIPALFGSRILEVLCIGLYPIASQELVKFADTNSSRKKVWIFIIILFVVLTGIYRYYSQIQRRVILS